MTATKKKRARGQKYYARRAEALTAMFGIDRQAPSGIYGYTNPLRQMEHVIHELAHVYAMGFLEIPMHVSEQVAGMQPKFSE